MKFANLVKTSLDNIKAHTGILLLRAGMGILILTHGIPKLINVFEGNFRFGDPIGLGPTLSLILSALAEGIASLFVIAGLWTRLATVLLIINMSTAFFIAHYGDPFGRKEKALMFLIVFVVLLVTGGGKYSLDHKLYGDNRGGNL